MKHSFKKNKFKYEPSTYFTLDATINTEEKRPKIKSAASNDFPSGNFPAKCHPACCPPSDGPTHALTDRVCEKESTFSRRQKTQIIATNAINQQGTNK